MYQKPGSNRPHAESKEETIVFLNGLRKRWKKTSESEVHFLLNYSCAYENLFIWIEYVIWYFYYFLQIMGLLLYLQLMLGYEISWNAWRPNTGFRNPVSEFALMKQWRRIVYGVCKNHSRVSWKVIHIVFLSKNGIALSYILLIFWLI